MKKLLIAVLAVTMLLGTLSGCNSNDTGTNNGVNIENAENTEPETSDSPTNETIIEIEDNGEILAWAEDVEVSLVDFRYFLYAIRSNFEQQALMFGLATEDTLFTLWEEEIDEDGLTMWDSLKEEALLQVQQFAVLHSLAMEADTPRDAAFEEEMERNLTEIVENMSSDPVEAENIVRQTYGVTLDQFKDIHRRMHVTNTFLEEFAHNIEISEEDIRSFFEENRDQYERVTVRHVLISSDDTMSEEEQTAARELAEDVFRQLVEGADIADLALQYTDDLASAETAGEYTFPRGQMVPEFEEWAFAAQEGDRDIVQTDWGYHIMEFISRNTFEDVQEEIHHALQHTMSDEQIFETVQSFADRWELDEELFNSITFE